MRTITDSKELHKLIAYLTMGDGGVYANGKSFYFVMTQRDDHLDFCEYARDLLENLTPTKIKHIDRSNNTDGHITQNLLLVETVTHPVLAKLRDHIYVDKYKGISPHYLKSLDWEAAAILFMGDGSSKVYTRPEIGMINPSVSVTLNMKRLSYGDQVLLKRALEEKGMGTWAVNRQNKYYYLSLTKKHADMFLSGIAPYIVPSYQYKLEWIAPTTTTLSEFVGW